MGSVPKNPLEKWNYFQEEVNKLFHFLFEQSKMGRELSEGGNYPPVDIYETDNCLFIEMELPGLDIDKISLTVSNDILIVEGEKKKQMEKGAINYLCVERDYGKFKRIIEIPTTGDTTKINAKYDQGLLIVTLPKIQERRGRRLQVPIGS